MSGRDWFELSWHAALLLLCLPVVLRWVLAHRQVRAAVALMIGVALVYHVLVVQACHAQAPLCYWG